MLPKAGTKLHRVRTDQDVADLVAGALALELGRTHQAVKTAMRWTGASERTVKNWLAGTHVPSGLHLLDLARHSETVFKHLLIATGRSELAIILDVVGIRSKLIATLAACEEILVP